MSININTKNYDTAREYLSAGASPLNDISIDIGEALKKLDQRIVPYIIGDYNYVNNQIKNVYASNEILSNEIENFKQKCMKIENKTNVTISNKNESILTEISKETSNSLTSQLLYVEEQAVIQNHIDNQEIAYLTASMVSDPTSTLSYNTPYVDEITSAANADIEATGAEEGGKSESFWGKVGNFFKGIGTFIVDSICHPFKTLVKTAASITNFAVGLVNGVLNFVEALVDCVALITAASNTIFTALIDLCQWVGGKITGNEDWKSATKGMWNLTMDFVATKWMNKLFDGFYEKTAIGKWIDDQAYGPFKHTGGMYKFSKGVGYVVGVVILTIVTYGVGGAAAGASGAAGSAGSAAAGAGASAAATSATSSLASSAAAVFTTKGGAALLGAIGAAAGTGKNTQNAWADGASLGEGLTYGVAMGAYEGLQFYGGARINMIKVPAATAAKSQLLTAGTHIALDTVDGASSGFVDPLLKMIYTPNEQNQEQILYYVNHDEYGNQIDNKTWDELTFGQKYKAMFEYNGGWKTVGTNAAIAGVLSTITEVPDIAAAVKIPKTELGTAGAEATEQAVKTVDVDATTGKNLTDQADAISKQTSATIGSKLRAKYQTFEKWISEKTGALWSKGKSIWEKITKKGDTSKNITDSVDTSAAKNIGDGADSTVVKNGTDGSAPTVDNGKVPIDSAKAIEELDEIIELTATEKAVKAKSLLEEAKATNNPFKIAQAQAHYAKATINAYVEKVVEYIKNLPVIKKIRELRTQTKEAINNLGIVKGVKKVKQKIVDGFNNVPIIKKIKNIKKTGKKVNSYMNAGMVQGPQLAKSINKLTELYGLDRGKMTADQLADWTKQVKAEKDAIAKLRIKKTDLENIIPFEKQVDMDMILLTDKMQRTLKTKKVYMTNDEILARVEQSSLDEFIKYVDSLPDLTPAKYAEVYKKFIACLGLTAAGYFVINGDFKK